MDLEKLKLDIWKKVKNNKIITKGNHHYEDIQYAIYKQTRFQLSKDTIRNFLEGRNQPSPRSLDIYATFILGGDQSNMKTILDYWAHLQENQLGTTRIISMNEVTITNTEYVEFVYVSTF